MKIARILVTGLMLAMSAPSLAQNAPASSGSPEHHAWHEKVHACVHAAMATVAKPGATATPDQIAQYRSARHEARHTCVQQLKAAKTN